MWIAWVVAIIVVLVMIKFLFGSYRCTSESGSECARGTYGDSSDSANALDILKKRFANGEIDEDTFEKMKKTLKGDGGV